MDKNIRLKNIISKSLDNYQSIKINNIKKSYKFGFINVKKIIVRKKTYK